MKEKIVTFETAKLAKEKGFRPIEDWNPIYVPGYLYDEDTNQSQLTEIQEEDWSVEDRYIAPSYSVLQDWLRETHHLHLIINWYQGYFLWHIKLLDADLSDRNSIRGYSSSARENDYYAQMELGLQAALKLIK